MRKITPGRPHLVVPGHREDFAKKAHSYGADFILWDLEDGVPAERRLEAVAIVQRYSKSGDAVRVPKNFGWGTHLELWFPKVDRACGRGVHIIESPSAVLTVRDIVSDPDVTALAFGTYDFAAACGVSPESPLVEHARLQVLLAAKAAGIPAYDAPCKDLDPFAAYVDACRAKTLGFDSKGVIHPSHLEGTRAAWSAGVLPLFDAQEVAALEHAGVAAGRFYIPAEIRAAKAQVEV